MPQLPLISWLSQLKKEDVSTIGIKAANLGEMTSLSLPVPNGFAIQAQAYYDFLAQTKLADKINQLISETDTHQSASLQKTSTAIAKLIKQAKMPDSLASQIVGAYHQLSAKDVFVAVRPSLTDAADLTALSNSNSISHLNILGSRLVSICF